MGGPKRLSKIQTNQQAAQDIFLPHGKKRLIVKYW